MILPPISRAGKLSTMLALLWFWTQTPRKNADAFNCGDCTAGGPKYAARCGGYSTSVWPAGCAVTDFTLRPIQGGGSPVSGTFLGLLPVLSCYPVSSRFGSTPGRNGRTLPPQDESCEAQPLRSCLTVFFVLLSTIAYPGYNGAVSGGKKPTPHPVWHRCQSPRRRDPCAI
jgi:hypothetical protein